MEFSVSTTDPKLPTAKADRRPRARAFTLLEVVVAVGLLAVVTVAIASVFATVGDTVTAGKRVSTLNRYSARLERVMRQDFEAMNRAEGFLVIRNEYARSDWSRDFDLTSDASKVALYDGEPQSQQRARRIDEIMFFAEGSYTSARTPVSPDLEASGGAARIYYGHGQKMPRDLTNDRYVRPMLDETNAYPEARLGEVSAGAVLNPNEFASDWTLLRHVTALIPETSRRRELPDLVYGLEPNTNTADYFRVADHSRQIAMQPAAQSIFRTLAYLPPRDIEVMGSDAYGIRPAGATSPRLGGNPPQPVNRIPWQDEPTTSPIYVGGLVDIAVTSMTDVKAWVTSPFAIRAPGGAGLPTRGPGGRLLPTYPSQKPRGVPNSQQWFRNYYEVTTRVNRDEFDRIADTSGKIAVMRGETGFTAAASTTQLADQAQQLWMLDALPSVPFDNRPQVVDNTGHRIRYEDQPPQLFASLDNDDPQTLLMEAIEQADQEMLSSAIFLPGCSEFIVEWTYGIVDERNGSPTQGQPIWYGLRRWAEFDNNPDTYQPGSGDVLLADLFGDTYDGDRVHGTFNVSDWFGGNGPLLNDDFRLPDDFIADPNGTPNNENDDIAAYPMQRLAEVVVLRDRTVRNGTYPDPELSAAIEQTFGYVDYDDDFDDDGTTGDIGWSPLPWPKMIRVTVRLTDPADETLETTYQATFRVPDPEAF